MKFKAQPFPWLFFFPCQFRMTQAIFRNALQKNALKNFILNIHELKISIQAKKKKCHKDSVLLSLMSLLFWLPFYVTTLKRGIWKDGRSPSSPPSPVAFLSCPCEAPPPWQTWSTVTPQSSMLCPVSKINIFSLGRIPKSISLTQVFLLCSRSQIFNCLLDRSARHAPNQLSQSFRSFPVLVNGIAICLLEQARNLGVILFSSRSFTSSQSFSHLFPAFLLSLRSFPFPLSSLLIQSSDQLSLLPELQRASWVIFEMFGMLVSGCCVILLEPI